MQVQERHADGGDGRNWALELLLRVRVARAPHADVAVPIARVVERGRLGLRLVVVRDVRLDVVLDADVHGRLGAHGAVF